MALVRALSLGPTIRRRSALYAPVRCMPIDQVTKAIVKMFVVATVIKFQQIEIELRQRSKFCPVGRLVSFNRRKQLAHMMLE